jgi:hypothetical protein
MGVTVDYTAVTDDWFREIVLNNHDATFCIHVSFNTLSNG